MIKRSISFLLVFVLLIGLLPLSTASISAKSQVRDSIEGSTIHTRNTQKKTASSVTEAYRAVLDE